MIKKRTNTASLAVFTKYLLLLLAVTNFANVFAQKTKKNAIGISAPVICSYAKGVFYGLGSRKEAKGSGIGKGIILNYSRQIFKNVIIHAGGGYFEQEFKISRPFNFDGDTLTKLAYSTKSYGYQNFHWMLGIGYRHSFEKDISIVGQLSFHQLNSFKQYYIPAVLSGYHHKDRQDNNRAFVACRMLSLSADIEKKLTKQIGIGFELYVPLIVRWRNDEVFSFSSRSSDAQQIAENRFSFGSALFLKFHF